MNILNNGVKVMVIDHKQDFLASVCEILKFHSFQVTSVDRAGTALRILTEGKEKFDLLLVASDMSEVDAITFLRLTKNMDVLSMVMHQETDDKLLLQVLENGGFRVVKTPLTDDVVMYLRDDVIRARFHKYERSKVFAEGETKELECGSSRSKRTANGGAKIKKVRSRRVCVVWTPEIHDKFLQAIHDLGDRKCFPREICDAMGVPGLTRLQVASHLQKCRLGGCKFLKKKGQSCLPSKSMLSDNLPEEVDPKMLGKNPGAATPVENHAQIGMNVEGLYREGNTDVNQSIKDISLVNGIGFDDFAEGYSVPSDSFDNLNSFPSNEVSANSFDLLDGMESPLVGLEFNVSGQNLNIYEQVLPTQGIPEFGQHI